MLFNSIEFLLFFPIVTGIYFLIPHSCRWLLLLLASCVFYIAFIPIYILILLVTITIDYTAGIMIEKAVGPGRNRWLVASIISTCLVLFVFKYFDFFNGTVAAVADSLHLRYPIGALQLILPIGLSFHTFQSLSYVIEVYRGQQKAEHHFGIYALYVMFYPQLVAGPIERPQRLLHQFRETHTFDYGNAVQGLKRMAWGMFKKVVVADRLSIAVNHVYNNPGASSGMALTIATVFFAFQIYCDFSGYSDIAVGAARVMGFRLIDNFNAPYTSTSISDFWKRWHISLSTWFRDYLYISLGGNRVGKPRWMWNLFLTFLISGLWHGANWTFVVWGAVNGAYLITSIWTEDLRSRISRAVGLAAHPRAARAWKVFATFVLVCVAWIFFRARNLSDALYILTHLASGWSSLLRPGVAASSVLTSLGIGKADLMIDLLLIVMVQALQFVEVRRGMGQTVSEAPRLLRWGMYYALLFGTVFLGVFTKNQFIYFQF